MRTYCPTAVAVAYIRTDSCMCNAHTKFSTFRIVLISNLVYTRVRGAAVRPYLLCGTAVQVNRVRPWYLGMYTWYAAPGYRRQGGRVYTAVHRYTSRYSCIPV
jgi:hypothetical protein